MFEKCNKCTFLLKILQSLSYECTGLTDFELTNERDIRTHPLKEMLTHLKRPCICKKAFSLKFFQNKWDLHSLKQAAKLKSCKMKEGFWILDF